MRPRRVKSVEQLIREWNRLEFAELATGVTGGDSHDHSGGDGATIHHGGLSGLSDDDHAQYWGGSNHSTLTVSDTEPVGPSVGDIWIDTSAL